MAFRARFRKKVNVLRTLMKAVGMALGIWVADKVIVAINSTVAADVGNGYNCYTVPNNTADCGMFKDGYHFLGMGKQAGSSPVIGIIALVGAAWIVTDFVQFSW